MNEKPHYHGPMDQCAHVIVSHNRNVLEPLHQRLSSAGTGVRCFNRCAWLQPFRQGCLPFVQLMLDTKDIRYESEHWLFGFEAEVVTVEEFDCGAEDGEHGAGGVSFEFWWCEQVAYTVEAKYSALLSVTAVLSASSPGEMTLGIDGIGRMKESWIIGGLPNAILRVLEE